MAEEKKCLQVHYFGFKARGFSCMVGAAYWGIDEFEWVKYSMESWKANKDGIKDRCPFGQLPFMVDGEIKMGQSNAIVRYCGRKWDKSGRNNEGDFIMSEMLIEETVDLFKVLLGAYFGGSTDELWDAALEKLKKHYGLIEALMNDQGEFCSEKTIGDMQMFVGINIILDSDPNAIAEYPKLTAWYKSIASNAAVAKLLKETPAVLKKGSSSKKNDAMPHVKLGSNDFLVSHVGLGCMGMSAFYTSDPVPEEQSLQTIKAALDQGVNFFDTAEVYGWGKNEILIGKAIAAYGRERFVICTKFGFTPQFKMDSSPENVKKVCDVCLERLGVKCIDVYYQHRVDPNTPIEDTVKAMAELVKEGKVRYLGLSEASADIIRRAHKIHPIACVQVEYSLFTRDIETNGVLETCRELGIAIVAYSPVGRGVLTGKLKSLDQLEDGDWRKSNPRFTQENMDHNAKIAEKVEAMAAEKGCSAAQLAIAWLLHQGDDVIPIPGTKRVKYVTENNGSTQVKLTTEEQKKLEEMCQGVLGDRYALTKHEGWMY